MMPARYVKPYVKRNKNDLAEFGIVAGVGRNGLQKLLEVIATALVASIPDPQAFRSGRSR